MTRTPAFDPTAYSARMRAEGWWADRTTDALIAEAAQRHPAKDALVVYRADRPGPDPVMEIENLLVKHPAVMAAALVGIPDPRLGERGCAFLMLRPGQSFDLAALQAYMAECKVAKRYWPERVEVVAELPRTPSGKIQKFVLREKAMAFAVS